MAQFAPPVVAHFKRNTHKAEKLEEMSKTMKTPKTILKDDEIDKMIERLITDYSEPQEAFKDIFERERREKAGNEFRKFQERLKMLTVTPVEYTNFEPINHLQNDDHNQETTPIFEG